LGASGCWFVLGFEFVDVALELLDLGGEALAGGFVDGLILGPAAPACPLDAGLGEGQLREF
jgi:hypothetical protein